jgi:hypothetical protein
MVAMPSVSKNLKQTLQDPPLNHTATARTVSPDKPGRLQSVRELRLLFRL